MNNNVWILQIADLHLIENPKNNLRPEKCLQLMALAIKDILDNGTDLILAVCGDLTSKGESRGYLLSTNFCTKLVEMIDVKTDVLICPGNHDINKRASSGDDPFAEYNKAAWILKQTEHLSGNTPTVSRVVGDIEFILTNSSYHRDHTFGKVDIISLTEVLTASGGNPRIVLVHHHIIPSLRDEGSSIRNAYEFLQLCVSNGVIGFLHGHVHKDEIITVGNDNSPIIGVGSLFFPPGPNYNNQFNLVRVNNGRIDKVIRFRYIADVLGSDGRLGVFVPHTAPLI